MDGDGKKPRVGKKAARPAPADDDTQQQPAARVALETPALFDDDATAAQQVDVDQPDVASVDESRSGGGGGTEQEEDNHDDDDEEQVERFYALLANIRAMRGLPLHKHNGVASSSSFCADLGGNTDTAVDSTRTKRLRRSAEPPWRPVFRMEDFESPPLPAASTSCKIRKRTTRGEVHDDCNGHGESSDQRVRRSPSSTMPHAAVRFQQSDSSS